MKIVLLMFYCFKKLNLILISSAYKNNLFYQPQKSLFVMLINWNICTNLKQRLKYSILLAKCPSCHGLKKNSHSNCLTLQFLEQTTKLVKKTTTIISLIRHLLKKSNIPSTHPKSRHSVKQSGMTINIDSDPSGITDWYVTQRATHHDPEEPSFFLGMQYDSSYRI